MSNSNDRQQRHEQNLTKARSYVQDFTDRMKRSTSSILGKINPHDPHLQLASQSLALAHISEGVEMLLSMGMDEADIQTLAGRAANRAKARQALVQQEIEADEADRAETDFIDQLATAHTKQQEKPEPGVDPNAPQVDPAPQPSDGGNQEQSPANSPQDKLATDNIASGGATVAKADADAAAAPPAPAPEQPAPDAPQTDAPTTQPVEQSTGTTDKLGVADQIDGEVVKGGDQPVDPQAKASADAQAAAAAAAS